MDALERDEVRNQVNERFKILNSGDHGDCLLNCGVYTLRLHSEILRGRSDWFRRALTGRFTEDQPRILNLQNFIAVNSVAVNFVRLVIQYIYLSIPQAGYDLQVFEPMNDDERFLRHMFDLFRHADIFGVQELKVALVTELRKRLDTFARVLFNKDVHSPASFKKALDCPMTAAVVAYDKSKLYWRSCEPIRSEIFCFVKDCYPVLSRLDNNDFDNYLLKAPKLILDISKQTSHIESSKFITPGPEVRCQFCGLTINNDRLPLLNSQPGFGITAGFDGRVRYFCSSSTCFRKIRIKDCFADN